ncbi:MAG TPA: sensor domain-containing diguanylate cyclase [Gaiellaceae bacterium]|nr:sensor domain-containing diguanylate cyclase [Gaiellaceae bacterium]
MSDAVGWAIVGGVLVVLAAVFFAVLVRERRAADRRLERAVQELTSRLDAMMGELHSAMDRTTEEERRGRILGELGGSIDLDEVLTRVLEAAGAIRGVDAALVLLPGPADEKPVIATFGLSAEEAERQAVAGPPDGREARSLKIAYEYPAGAEIDDGDLIRHGLAVPIPGEAGPIGFMSVFSRSAVHSFADGDRETLEDLAERAGPAIDNARRFREAKQLADLDALTGLHNRRFFHETLGREVARAHRYGRRLALVVFDLDDFKAINDRIGHLAGDSVLAEVAERVRSVVRSADIACRVGGDEFGIILPESTLADAEQLSRRMQQAVAARPIGDVGQLELSAGAADLRPEDDGATFFKRADDALYQAKEGGKADVVAAPGQHADPNGGTAAGRAGS